MASGCVRMAVLLGRKVFVWWVCESRALLIFRRLFCFVFWSQKMKSPPRECQVERINEQRDNNRYKDIAPWLVAIQFVYLYSTSGFNWLRVEAAPFYTVAL